MSCLEKRKITFDYVDCTQIIQTLNPEDLSELEQKLQMELGHYEPSLVGIGPCVTPGIKGLEVVVRCCLKKYGIEKVFAGGPFTSLQTQDWVFYEYLGLKYLIKGEGEIAVCEAVEAVKNGCCLGDCDSVSFEGRSIVNKVENVDDLPFPKRVQLDKEEFSNRRKLKEKGRTAHIVASRGCPYHCDYCVSGNLNIPFRRRSPQNIVSEMSMLKEKYGITDVVFYDDCFFTSVTTVHKEIEAFCKALDDAEVIMTWQIEIRPDILMEISDEEIKVLSDHGCRQMNIGIEKTNSEGASVFGKRFDYNRLKDFLAHVHKICSIRMTGTFILGGKGETEKTVRQLIDASVSMNLDDAEYSPLFVYPDTPIYNEVFNNPKAWLNLILSSNKPWGEIVYETKVLNKSLLIDLVEEAYNTFYEKNNKSDNDRIQDRYHLRG